MENKLKLFNEKQIRAAWDAEEEEWYFFGRGRRRRPDGQRGSETVH